MATIPVAPVLPDINSSANVAFSRWNGMIDEGQKQYADYFANLVRIGQIGSSMPLDESIAQGTVIYGGEKIKIGEFFDEIDSEDIDIPSALLSKKIIALCALYEFSFECENSSTTGTDGTVIPVEINYECMWNNNRYVCLVDFSDFDSTCDELSGYYESSTKTTKTFTRLAKRVVGQGASDRLTVYANGINVPEDQDPTTVSSQVSILVPLAIFVNTGTSFESYNVVDSVVPHDIDSSLASTDSWGLPYIRDQLVTGSSGFSKATNKFDVDIEGVLTTKIIQNNPPITTTASTETTIYGLEVTEEQLVAGTNTPAVTRAFYRPGGIEQFVTQEKRLELTGETGLRFWYTNNYNSRGVFIVPQKDDAQTLSVQGISGSDAILNVVGTITASVLQQGLKIGMFWTSSDPVNGSSSVWCYKFPNGVTKTNISCSVLITDLGTYRGNNRLFLLAQTTDKVVKLYAPSDALPASIEYGFYSFGLMFSV